MTGEVYKSVKLNGNSNIISNGQPTVTDDGDEDDEVAGPEMPPDLEDEMENDEEGRFFGGGITSDTAEVLDFIDERDQEVTTVRTEDLDAKELKLNETLRNPRGSIQPGYESWL
jgi:beta-catenin-like protein 1